MTSSIDGEKESYYPDFTVLVHFIIHPLGRNYVAPIVNKFTRPPSERGVVSCVDELVDGGDEFPDVAEHE